MITFVSIVFNFLNCMPKFWTEYIDVEKLPNLKSLAVFFLITYRYVWLNIEFHIIIIIIIRISIVSNQ